MLNLLRSTVALIVAIVGLCAWRFVDSLPDPTRQADKPVQIPCANCGTVSQFVYCRKCFK